MIDRLRAGLLDKDTLEQRRAADDVLREQRRCAELPATEEDARGIVGIGEATDTYVAVAGARADLSPGIFDDVEMHSPSSASSSSTTTSATYKCAFDAVCGLSSSSSSLSSSSPPPTVYICAGTRLFLGSLVAHPVRDLDVLLARRAVIERCLTIYENDDDEDERRCAALEPAVAWLFRGATSNGKTTVPGGSGDESSTAASLYEMAYFSAWSGGALLNRVPAALTLWNLYRIVAFPLVGALTPIVCFLVPYLVLRWRLGLPISFRTYLWIMYRSFVTGDVLGGPSPNWAKHLSLLVGGLFYFQSVFTSLEMARALRIVCRSVDGRVREARAFFARARRVVERRWDDGVRDAFFPGVEKPSGSSSCSSTTAAQQGRQQGRCHGEEDDDAIDADKDGRIKRVTTFGSSLKERKFFDAHAHRALARAFYAVQAIRRVCALATRPDFSLVDWIAPHPAPPLPPTNDNTNSNHYPPRLDLRQLWHPCLRPDAAVANDVRLGDAAAPNMLLTGPNAGGKSMLLKGSALATLLAQSLGVAPCRAGARMQPFTLISCQINVPDVKGERSLFEEEMHRAKAALAYLRDAGPEARALIIVDEIFSSTNPVEGIAGAYAVALNLARHASATCIISTHYTYLCRLQRRDSRRFVNAQMPVAVVHQSGSNETKTPDFEYPYRLMPGVCRQYIALELLRRNAFDEQVLDDALRVKASLVAPAVRE